MEKVVAFLARNLEADVAGVFSMDYWLLTFTANDFRPEIHGSPFNLLGPHNGEVVPGLLEILRSILRQTGEEVAHVERSSAN
jgi:hypothetical protein